LGGRWKLKVGVAQRDGSKGETNLGQCFPFLLLERNRVTRLGEFSPFSFLFTLGSFLNKEVAHILGYYIFYHGFRLCIKKLVGLQHFGRFFHRLIWSPWKCMGLFLQRTKFIVVYKMNTFPLKDLACIHIWYVDLLHCVFLKPSFERK
jgi:hypothetical protein